MIPSIADTPEVAATLFNFLSFVRSMAQRVAPPCATLLQDAIASRKEPPAATIWISTGSRLWCIPVMVRGEYKNPKAIPPTIPNVSCIQTKLFVNISPAVLIIPPTTVNVTKPVIITVSSGVRRLSRISGIYLCSFFSTNERIYEAASTGSTVP